jgi:hypothetical protein
MLPPALAALTVVLVLAATGAASAGAAGSGAPSASSAGATGSTGATTTPALTATLTACHADAVPANRYAIFGSQTIAAAVPDTLVMAVDFELQERSPGGPFETVRAAGFGTWVPSQPRVGIFTYNHEVTALPAPASFRVLVKARWIGRHRRLLHETAALSPVCVEPLIAPDLAVGRITRAPGAAAGNAQYTVEIHNQGSAAAGPFQVSLTVGATALAPVTIPGLAAGAWAPAIFSGPACTAGTTLIAAADPSGTLSEPADPRRTRTQGCPPA